VKNLQALKILDLFSGIGGFSLGLERTGGFETVAFCEIEPFPRAVLKEHWPDVPCYEDVRTLTADQLRSDGISVDVICGGFPCQDISYAGGGAGLEGARSGLWSEIARLVSELRPQYVIVENVSALLSRGLGRVLGDLAQIGYDAEWHCIPASAVGAPHRRDRIWIVAYPASKQCDGRQFHTEHIKQDTRKLRRSSSAANVAYPAGGGCEGLLHWNTKPSDVSPSSEDVANASIKDVEGFGLSKRIQQERNTVGSFGWWRTEPDVGRVANGVPFRVDRLKGLGNAVVPQIPEIIGRAILASAYRSEAPRSE